MASIYFIRLEPLFVLFCLLLGIACGCCGSRENVPCEKHFSDMVDVRQEALCNCWAKQLTD